ncbi:putative MATE family efflux protein [Cohnella sp. SGD-V74]|uniref:MATE family efflux transporter n=1 Tax=unclassified Cohnella TaxID=2636738 RepID=UPI000D40523C|nr:MULTISPECIES: MATE family efflux transporter [unclassified Cohnella]PRX71042.1 putative MATE family efflux protein [Cohnella sp. SGD-V74]
MKKNRNPYGLWMLAWPIFIEVLLQTLLGTVDTVMVSRISDDAVAVVGLSGQLFAALTTLFMTISGGAGILIAQKLGAKRGEDARTIAIMSLTVSGVIGLAISVLLYAQAENLAGMLGISDELLPLWNVYVSYFGGGMVLTALIAALSTAIRNTGNTRTPMYIGIAMNVVHIVLNYVLIFGMFGFPEWGLFGVTVSGNVSRLIAVLLLFYVFVYSFDRKIGFKDLLVFKPKLFKEVLHIGWPLGVNMSGWVFSQLAIYAFIAMLGAAELATKTYMNTLESFCFMLGYAISLAVQIQVAHLFGAGKTREAYVGAYRALGIGLGLAMLNALLLLATGRYLLGLFSQNEEILALGTSLLALNLLLQPGKVLNMSLNNALNAVGDTRYTMMTALFSLSLVATAGSYWLGIHAGWGLAGIYCCMIADEWVRGVLVLRRWKGQKYLRKAEEESRISDSRRMAAETGLSV